MLLTPYLFWKYWSKGRLNDKVKVIEHVYLTYNFFVIKNTPVGFFLTNVKQKESWLLFSLPTVMRRKPTGQWLHFYPKGRNVQEVVSVVNWEDPAFVMTQTHFSRQPMDERECLSCIILNEYPENIKSPGRSTDNFPSVIGPSLMLLFK